VALARFSLMSLISAAAVVLLPERSRSAGDDDQPCGAPATRREDLGSQRLESRGASGSVPDGCRRWPQRWLETRCKREEEATAGLSSREVGRALLLQTPSFSSDVSTELAILLKVLAADRARSR